MKEKIKTASLVLAYSALGFGLSLALFLSVTVKTSFGGEWAKIDSSGTVQAVQVADSRILDREDGPWIRTYSKVGIGWTFDGVTFTAPVSTATPYYIIISTP